MITRKFDAPRFCVATTKSRSFNDIVSALVILATDAQENRLYIPQAAQPTDHPGVVMVGQPVVGNWGAMCPMGIGVIVGFMERMATRWTSATTMAVIRWDDGHTSMEALEDIHPRGWRSPSGSPLGVFFAR